MQSGVYGIYNLITGMPYIGSAQDLDDRQGKHFWMLRNNRHDNIHLQRAFNKYGEDNFQFEVLELVKVDELLAREQEYIDYYGIDSLYNICPFAGAPMRGRKSSKETREKLCVAKRGDKHHMYGKQHSPETRKKIAAANLGHQHTDKARAKMSASHRGKKLPLESIQKTARANMKPVKQLDKHTGEVLRVFDSISDAAQSVGLKSIGNIGSAIACKHHTAGGYKWQYA